MSLIREKKIFSFPFKNKLESKKFGRGCRYCRAAHVPLKIAGGSRPFLKRLSCFLTPSLQWVGPVSGVQKAQLLSFAKALVFPVIWPEPFGLVVAEAFMSGTPVVASPLGSMIEMVPPSVGILPRSPEEWVDAFLKKNHSVLSPEKCRQWAMEKFHYLKMAAAYEIIYQRVTRGQFLHEQHPVSEGWRCF